MSHTNDEAAVIALDKDGSKKRKGRSWLDRCVLGETGKPLAVLANALAALRSEMPDTFGYDEMLCAPLLMRPLENEPCFNRAR